jgi:ethanolamine utilization protein EutS
MNDNQAHARIIQELVPGKQLTLAHIIANPAPSLYASMQINNDKTFSAIGILTITPPETAIIIADIAVKSSGAGIISADRTSGSLIINGSVAEVEAAVQTILEYVKDKLGFEVCNLTKT